MTSPRRRQEEHGHATANEREEESGVTPAETILTQEDLPFLRG
jgi:hypothetical protein